MRRSTDSTPSLTYCISRNSMACSIPLQEPNLGLLGLLGLLDALYSYKLIWIFGR